jgi:7-cyano-7-deazaguanine reductase
MEKSDYEGLQEDLEKIELKPIEIFKYKYSGSDPPSNVTIETNELTSVCPKTGLPDFYSITIKYRPYRSCAELKSFKEYLFGYRNVGIFHEHLARKILDDFVNAVDPLKVHLELSANTRGGINTTVELEYSWAYRSKMVK